VPRSTFDYGYAILNADDDLVYDMSDDLDCNIAYFSMDVNNERIRKHCAKGGLAAVIEKGYLTVCKGEWKIRVNKVEHIPLTINGRAECMIKNILPAVLAAIIQNFRLEDIRAALSTFIPSPEITPGRMNLFSFKNFEFMIDYAHNPGGFMELKTFLERTKATRKVGIITGVGDRRDEDIRNLGIFSGKMFDEVIIRHDKDMRGRSQEEVSELLIEGIKKVNQQVEIHIISNELDAVKYTIDNAQKGDFIVLCTDSINESTAYVKQRQQEEKETNELLHSLTNH
jgi:cyanophycin synthetase